MLGDRPLDLAQPVHRRISFWNQTDFNWRKFPIFVVAGHVDYDERARRFDQRLGKPLFPPFGTDIAPYLSNSTQGAFE